MTSVPQSDLFSFRAERDAAIKAAQDAADAEWMTAAQRIVRTFATRDGLRDGPDPTFTADDVWAALDELDVHTSEPRALGAVMQQAARAKIIEKTGAYAQTTRKAAHCRPIPIWKRGPNG